MRTKQNWVHKKFKYGKHQIWLEVLLSPLFMIIPSVILYAFVHEGVGEHYLGAMLSSIFMFAFFWGGVSYFISLVNARWLVYSVSISSDTVEIACYYNRNFVYTIPEILEVIKLGKTIYTDRFRFISHPGDSYCIKTVDGKKFYLLSPIESVESLLQELKS